MYLTYFNERWSEGNTPLFGAMDHSVWLGSSIFDGARSVRGHVPDLRLHLQRAIQSAERVGLQCPYTVDEMEALCREGIQRFPADAELYIRPLVFGTDGLLIPEADKSGFALTLFDAPMPPFAGFSACLSELRRPDPLMAPTDAKASCLYPNTTKALREAKQRGFDNAVVCDIHGNVAEFATANLFLVTASGELVTPAPNGSFLSGITRARVIALLAKTGTTVAERTVKPEELDTAQEIFNTGNFGKVMPCTRYESRELPIGPIASKARELYMAYMEEN
ncbi:branched-chain amino acid aminotransferase [Undibacterium sp.]|jgi:branched-chain amino acid aminotransferase|uniref:branched-chain amino acid aminotransferase n=1 Tax=Undibacterium sp. TaxID=1914977 RepID=UPI002C89445F|nr:branched-chain amino acid aminotransferase [Undibacterium sp.]HTD04616.1 branched-chain amino acid aminotransferase [Undibacterium sp.]